MTVPRTSCSAQVIQARSQRPSSRIIGLGFVPCNFGVRRVHQRVPGTFMDRAWCYVLEDAAWFHARDAWRIRGAPWKEPPLHKRHTRPAVLDPPAGPQRVAAGELYH